MREIDGSPTPRSEAVDRIAGVLREHGSGLVGTRRPDARVALLYSRESDALGRIQDFHTGPWDISQENGNVEYPAKRALHAAHALYLMAGETVDWVVPGDDLAGRALLHVTCAEMIAADSADWLRSYVRDGGALVVEFPFACRDDNTWVSRQRPNHGLEDLLGCREVERVVIPPQGTETVSFAGATRVEARGWRVELEPADGEVLATWGNGSVAAVRHRFGGGTVVALGVNLALSFGDSWDCPVGLAFSRVLDAAGLARPDVPAGLWLRRRCAGDREILFVFNVSDEARELQLPQAPGEVWYAEGAQCEGKNLNIEPGGTWVARLAVDS